MKISLLIIIALIVLFFFLYIDFYFGRKHQLKKINRHNHPFRYTDFTIYCNGNDLFPELFSTLKHAKHHIHILFYTVKTDSISNEFFALLREKAKEGVEVRLVLDWLGSLKIRKKIINELKGAGIEFYFCHIPKLPFFFYSLQVRNHRKIAIVDGKIGFMGGFNIGKDYINANLKLSPWRDCHIKMTGEGLDDLQREFLKDWLGASKINLLQNQIYFPSQPKGASRHQLIASKGKYLEEILSHLIRNAKKSIIICTPYFIPTKQIMKELLFALDRNVEIMILLPNNADHILVKEASFSYLRKLLVKNADVFQYTHGFFHSKITIVDDEICFVGSSNFDKRSILLNHELNCSVYDKKFIGEMKKQIQNDLSVSNPLLLADIEKPTIWTLLKEKIAHVFSSFL
ncbi:cardiolipin synthase [Niallia sp. NCCP-28]|uniref:cardiolipin synthase n=1 Tax=Niallia sp. NCCP-28 TaxID=2934712 RepID=UPI00208C7713|nr:cardiolipin synthase [Niallia sp. NCCP-28]GKU83696.1 cardiolipin synthase [Niallia sp. NCCP-28]